MKQYRKIFLLLIVLISTLITSSCDLRGKINPGPFNEYTAGLFKTLVSDEMTSNFLFDDPTSLGLDAHYEPRLPTPSSDSVLSLAILNLYFGQMPSYKFNDLTFDQQMTYLIVEEFLDNVNALTGDMRYLDNDFLGSYLGYQAQLPLLLSEYKFRDLKDIENYFVYMDLVPTTFTSYVDYEIEKADKGYGMPDFVIDKVIAQCEAFLQNIDEHFLIVTFADRIKHLAFLSESQKESFLLVNTEKVTGPLASGYRYVKDNLSVLKGRATNNLGLSHYEIGKDYYTLKFKKVTGYDIKIEEAITYLDQKLSNRYASLLALVLNNPNLNELIAETILMESDPYDQIMIFTTLIENHFPLVTIPEVVVKYIDPSMQDHFSPAAYMTSPIDRFTNEFVFLNEKYINDDLNYLYTTLAHEAFPGHMYQNIYFKSLEEINPLRKVIKNNGYVEGWATYAEMYSYRLANINETVKAYLLLNDELNGALTARIDIGIHYQGWDESEVQDFIKTYNPNYTYEQAVILHQRMVEVPTNSQAYFFSYFKLVDMYEKAKNTLGDAFYPVAFHQVILNAGPVPLRFVEEEVNKYLNLTK